MGFTGKLGVFEFLLHSGNLPFTTSLAIMVALGLLELLSTLAGLGLSHALDSALPDLDFDGDFDVHVGGHDHFAAGDGVHASPSIVLKALSWTGLGRVPAMVLLILWLTCFGVSGLALQKIAAALFGAPVPALLAVVPALAVTVPTARLLAGLIGRVIPRDETSAVSSSSFIGRVAIVTLGTARPGQPAEARLKDEFGQSHYVMVEPDEEGESFETGSDVLLVRQVGAIFKAIRNQSSVLID